MAALESCAKQYDPHIREELVVLAFLLALLQLAVGEEFNRNTLRAINRTRKALRPDERLIKLMADAFADISRDDWGAQYPLEADDYEEEAGHE